MVAVCIADADQASARGRSGTGTKSGQERLHGRPFEGVHGADDEHDYEDGLLALPAGGAPPSQRERGQAFYDLTEPCNGSAIIPVCNVTHGERQEEHGQELRKPDEAEIQRTAGEGVDLPTHGNGLHLEGDHGRHPCKPEQDKRTVPENLLWFM